MDEVHQGQLPCPALSYPIISYPHVATPPSSSLQEKRVHIYERLCFADQFEKFLANKFNTAKRFGLEGGDSCIPGLKCMVDRGSELGIESFAFGMPHRSGCSFPRWQLRSLV